jgi:hypothetical protein
VNDVHDPLIAAEMKSLNSVSLCLYLLLSLLYFTRACDNQDHQHHTLTDDDEILFDGVFNNRSLSGSMVEVCGYVPPSMEEMEEDAINMKAWTVKQMTHNIFARSEQLYAIPVYFHVIQTSSSGGIVSDARIDEYISYLNNAYTGSSAPFSFVSNGVSRTIRSDWGKCNDYDTEISMKKLLKVGGADTLNVYICNNMYTSKGAPLTGFATRPYANSRTDPRDGVVIDNSSSTGRLNTLVHEVVRDACPIVVRRYLQIITNV